MTRHPLDATGAFRRACHPLLLAAVALACQPARPAPPAPLNLVPPPLPLRLILPPPYALDSGVVTDIGALWRRNGGLWEPGMVVLVRETRTIRGAPFAAPEPATTQVAWTSRQARCDNSDAGWPDEALTIDHRP